MVCVPCIVIPFFLFIWHRWIQPIVLSFWNPWKSVDEKKKEQEQVEEKEKCLLDNESTKDNNIINTEKVESNLLVDKKNS